MNVNGLTIYPNEQRTGEEIMGNTLPSNSKMKQHECKNCKQLVLWVDSNGLCISCEDEFCPTCGAILGKRPCLTCEGTDK